MKIGTTELILILVVALVIFGPSKLPELGKLAGRAIGSFKKYVNSYEADWEDEERKQNEKTAPAKAEAKVVEVKAMEAEGSAIQSEA